MDFKIYVDVLVLFERDGALIPLELIWDDGRRFRVQKICGVKRAVSQRAGQSGIRFKCIIEGVEKYLYLEDSSPCSIVGAKWFVEAK